MIKLSLIAVARRIVRRGVRTAAVGNSLDERRAATLTRAIEQSPCHRETSEDIVAVDAHRRDAVSRRASGQRDTRLTGDRDRDGPLIVLHQEDNRRLERRSEHHRLMHIAGARRTVTEAGEHGLISAIALNAHGIAHRVQCM